MRVMVGDGLTMLLLLSLLLLLLLLSLLFLPSSYLQLLQHVRCPLIGEDGVGGKGRPPSRPSRRKGATGSGRTTGSRIRTLTRLGRQADGLP